MGILETKRHYLNFGLEIFLLAANLRVAIITIPPLISQIQATFKLTNSQAGFLTTIPLLCFGFLSVSAGRLITNIGTDATLKIALLLLAISNLLRVYTHWTMIAGTIAVGASITLLNLLMPVLILERQPDKATTLNGLYTAAMGLFSAVVGAIAVPLAAVFGWQLMVQLISILAVIAVIGWFFVEKPMAKIKSRSVTTKLNTETELTGTPIWQRPEVWLLAFFMGLQSLVFYTIVAWLPKILVAHQLSAATAGTLYAVFQIAGVPFSFLVPRASGFAKRLYWVLVALLVGYTAGFGILMLPTQSIGLLLLACIVLGAATAAIFSLSLSFITVISRSPEEAGSVGGLVQSIGYLLASLGPTIFAVIKDDLQTWPSTLMVLLAVAGLSIIVGFIMVRANRKNLV